LCEVRIGSRDFDSNLRLELKPAKSTYPLPGFMGDCFFLKNEWNHIAFVWEIKEGKKMDGDLAIFLNGKRLIPSQGYTKVAKLKGSSEFKLSYQEDTISIGPFDGTIDLLRISDTVRYAENFMPSKNYGLDNNSRVLFDFNGNLKGISAFSKEPVEAK